MMKKKADWPIRYCIMCEHLKYSPISDAFCGTTGKYLWLNGYRMVNGKYWPEGKSTSNYIPDWCPLENY